MINWGEFIGTIIRLGSGAACFGVWQNSFLAGAFMFVVLVQMEPYK